MATYTADVTWRLRDGDDFLNRRYSRGHTVSFDGGTVVPASASPHGALRGAKRLETGIIWHDRKCGRATENQKPLFFEVPYGRFFQNAPLANLSRPCR